MRIAFEGGDVHAWLPAGFFTIHPRDRITWRTRDDRLTEHASSASDGDVHVTPSIDEAIDVRRRDDVRDAALVGDGLVAIAYGGEAPRVELVGGPVVRDRGGHRAPRRRPAAARSVGAGGVAG